MDMKAFKAELAQKALDMGYTDWEIVVDKGKGFDVKIFEGAIAQYKNATTQSLCFRGAYKGKMGYASTELVAHSVLGELLENARSNAQAIEDSDIERLYEGGGTYPTVNTYNEALNNVDGSTKIQAAKDMETYAFQADPRVVGVDSCGVGSGEGSTHMANSYGLDLHHKSNMVFAYLSVRVTENEQTKVASDIWFGQDFAAHNPKAFAEKVAQKALSYLGASQVPSGAYQVVLDNQVASNLFAAYVGVFFAESAQKGFSLLRGKVGENIASQLVTLRDDGVFAGSLGNIPFDSEGVATQNKVVVANGVLQTLLYNMKSAEKEGIQSTGNGFKKGAGGTIGTACINFTLEPGASTQTALIQQMGTGLFVTEIVGLHAGTNTISGDFSLSAQGFLVEEGNIGKAVDQITIAGNFFQLLQHIVGVGNDLYLPPASENGTIGMPSIFIDGLDVSGE